MRTSIYIRSIAGVILILAFLGTIFPVSARTDPSAGYCMALGYTYFVKADPQGNEMGYCTLPDGRSVPSWDFLMGQTGQTFGYCAKNGYSTQVVNDSKACEIYSRETCAACIFPNGSGVEVTRLMNLDFREPICYGNTCRDPKDYPLPPPYVIPPDKIVKTTTLQPTTVPPTPTKATMNYLIPFGAVLLMFIAGGRKIF